MAQYLKYTYWFVHWKVGRLRCDFVLIREVTNLLRSSPPFARYGHLDAAAETRGRNAGLRSKTLETVYVKEESVVNYLLNKKLFFSKCQLSVCSTPQYHCGLNLIFPHYIHSVFKAYYILDSLLEDIDENLQHPILWDRWLAYSCNF